MTAKRNYTPLDATELVDPDFLGTGAGGGKFLKDDQTWDTPPGSGAPTAADYLVGTSQAGLSAEIVVGTTPGGELGGTWASPTVDATHSGSAHHAQDHHARHEDGGADEIDLTGLSGAPADLTAHLGDAVDAHDASAVSIVDSGNYFTGTEVEAALQELGTAAFGGGSAPSNADYLVGTAQGGLSAEIVVGTTPGGELGGTWASPTVDATHAGSTHVALGTTPSTQAFGDSAAGGSDATASKNDHKHAWPALGTTAAAIGTSAGGSATTPSKSDHVHATGAGTPSTQAFGDAAATGSGPAAAMTDHKHAMPTAFAGFSGAKVKNSGTQSRATNTVFLWDQEDYDTDAYHDTGSNTGNLVVPATGKYAVGAFIKSNGTITAGKYILYLQNNGADLPVAQQDSAALAAGGVQLTVQCDALLTAGDVITVKCASAGTTTWDTACRAWIHRIG